MFKNKKHITLVFFILIVLLFGVGIFFQNSKKYLNIPNEEISASDPEGLMAQLMEREENFRGSVGYKFTDTGKEWIEIELKNTSVGEFSPTEKNLLVYARKNGEEWRTTAKRVGFRCKFLFINFWTTNGCG